MCEKNVEWLLTQLHQSEIAYAKAYLQYREHESKPGHFLSVDDARANAVADLAGRGIELPEILRFRLHSVLGIISAVEPA